MSDGAPINIVGEGEKPSDLVVIVLSREKTNNGQTPSWTSTRYMTLLEKPFSALVLIIVYTCIVFLSYINAYLWRNVDLVIVKIVIEFSVDIYVLRSL